MAMYVSTGRKPPEARRRQVATTTIEFKIKSCAPYAKGWQVNAFVDGIESEMTFYGYTKADALAAAKRRVAQDGRLPHEPYKG
jgi:hypothetical protein